MNDSDKTGAYQPGTQESPAVAAALPPHIGRFRVEKTLGQGGFGIVYLAHDDQLQRLVAIKVPHHDRVSSAEDAEAYLTEARTVANLDHPNIVPVYDVGSAEDCPCFVVSKFIDGCTLARKITGNQPTFGEATELIATIAEALHYAHRKGVVHRDIKPSNILIDTSGKPFVVDFGLALKEENIGHGRKYAGTPAYMSPEQARGERHRVDGRSDIFSLGVVFYESLTGRRPFHAESRDELLEQINTHEARPLRQWDETIPKELERICLKALSKRASERYTTASDLADDLRHFLMVEGGAWRVEGEEPPVLATRHTTPTTPFSPSTLHSPLSTPPTPTSDHQPLKIVPKGLRSFDANDADFFLELLPGPRDRDGLPDSIRFWKTRIEETDAEKTFSVGLICGPSGCGKSSLVKAGLLPRLADRVIAVYVEATAEETETRLLNGLRKRCPSLPADLGLKESLAALRRGQGFPVGKKVLIVLDQFEQWLHANRQDENTELVQALRHCNGERVQCIVMVRDDFWMAVIRFMRELEVRLLEGQNSAAVDLFPIRHAEKVLAAFGRAFGTLPDANLFKPIDPTLQALVSRLEHLSDQYRELRDGVQKAIQVADFDPEMALTRTRKVLEYVIRDVYARRINEMPGTRPLENLVQRIVKDGHFPNRLDAFANTIRKLGNVGTHTFGEKVTVADVHQSLGQLVPILEWYFEVERPEAMGQKPTRTQPIRIVGGPSVASMEHKEFLDQAVSGLAQDGKVICVRLALFAEMMKGKVWTPTTLKEVGGTEGVGVTFLEETFSAASAPPEHRYHQKASRAVLKALLPESGTDIKGHMRFYAELLEASGYASRPKDFDDLIRILDSELRLITPTDPEGKEDDVAAFARTRANPEAATNPRSGERGYNSYYQLTHDYLVHSLREWLTRKQKESRRGRAELLLADRAAVWKARPENRQLPSLRQWLSIRWLTAKKNWTPPQRKMIAKAGRYHAVRGMAIVSLVAIATITGLTIRDQVTEKRNANHAADLVKAVLNADMAKVPALIGEMSEYRKWADPRLREEYDKATNQSRQKLNASLALLPVDSDQFDYLYDRLLTADPEELRVIRDALKEKHIDVLVKRLRKVVEASEESAERRLRAACALAGCEKIPDDAGDSRWQAAAPVIAKQLLTAVQNNPSHYALLLEFLRPAKSRLLTPLGEVYRDKNRPETERGFATTILADYAADVPQVLADLLMDGDEKQFAVIFPKLKDLGEQGLPILTAEIDKKLPFDLASSDESREKLAKRQANAAVALLRMNQPDRVWPLLKHTPDPRVRSYLIHKLSPLGADAKAIVKRLGEESDITIRRALILSLGEFVEKDFAPDDCKVLLSKLQGIYRTDADPGLHAASEWLLRTWEQDAWLKQVNEEWAKNKEQRKKRLEGIEKALAKEKTPPQWYVNTQGQTMVVIPGPVEFVMGSPKLEKDHLSNEFQNKRRISRTFAVAAKSVTLEQYRSLTKDPYRIEERFTRSSDLSVVAVSWYMAVNYCNLLNKEEGIDENQWCYETDGKGQATKLKPNYLSLTGYRLPTEAEMEYATRAGAGTCRYFGETEELLGHYAWYTKNSNELIQRVGTKKPNDFGVFDAHGNCFTWCQEPFDDYPNVQGDAAVEDNESKLVVVGTDRRVLRGGSFLVQASTVRSAFRNYNVPSYRIDFYGFRVARTLRPVPLTALPLPGAAGTKIEK